MRVALAVLLLLLLAPLSWAQTPSQTGSQSDDCLSEDHEGRISGKVVYDRWIRPYRKVLVDGYKIVLLKPRCLIFTSPNDDKLTQATIEAAQLEVASDARAFFKRNVGKLVTVTGEIHTFRRTAIIAWPQIDPTHFALCEITPKSKSVEKC
jgi:hypothetical protein